MRFRDLAVENAVVPAEQARYRRRVAGGAWEPTTHAARLPPATGPLVVELASSHDGGADWSPSTRVTVVRGRRGGFAVSAIERDTR